MNRKDIAEIKKQFSPENCAITRISGCYVDHEKNMSMTEESAFLSLSEEENFKYYELFRKTLSGTVGKNLLNMEFPLEQEAEGGTQEFLLKLRDSKLQDPQLLESFYNKVVENYYYAENYYIILVHAMYDIPGKSSDGAEMFDASDEVYEYILCSICPVNLSKAALCYNAAHNRVEDRIRDWLVEPPLQGFLFPAFADRGSDIHHVLYYSKKAEEIQTEFIDQVLGSAQPLTAGTQKDSFNAIIADTLGDDGDYEIIKSIHENLNEIIEENKEEPEPLELTSTDVKKIFEQSGVPQERMEPFEERYKELAGERGKLLASNIASPKKFNIETPDIVIRVNPDRADLIETRIIDDKQCLVIAVDDHIEVNGVNVRTIRKHED
ncbi:MAG: DUF4317 domain-containing protein [Lachnospiraceae bacterium]|nr:DUF4317 domain-containing protein [Lachnospiraceae bacterium]